MLVPALLGILHCPLCPPPAILRAPVTLHCGHTFCASHFSSDNTPSSSKTPDNALLLPRCPLTTCSQTSRAPATFPHVPPIDVTTNKLIDLLITASRDPELPPPSFHEDSDDRTDSEYEVDSDSDLEYLPLPPQSRQPSNDSRASSSSAAASVPSRQSGQSGHDTSPPIQPVPSRSRSRSPSGTSPQLHPRKRRRRHTRRTSAPRPSRSPSHRNDHDRQALLKKELLSELTCEICFGLFWQPVTTPCQHTFCIRCLFRSLDHSQTCPLCRQKLPGYDYFQQHPCNKVILAIILKAFPDAYAERGAMVEADERDQRLDTPVFVCQLSFPGMPTILHFFEPRYRLMLRRCLESPNPCFGMIPPPRAAPSASSNGNISTGNDYGTMLQIRNVNMLPDGRSIVETWGTWRFRIMERGMRDGYTVARVERIEDYEEELEGGESVQEGAGAAAAAAAEESASEEPSREAGAQLSSANATGNELRPRPSEAQATDSLAEAYRAGEQLEAAVRVEIGDVFVPVSSELAVTTPMPVAASTSTRALGSPSSSPTLRSEAPSQSGVSAIPGPSTPINVLDRHPTALTPIVAHAEAPAVEKRPGSRTQSTGMSSSPSSRPPSNAELMAKCHAFIEQTREGIPWVGQHLSRSYVPMPSDPASFSFWMALVLPIDEHEKAKLLPIRSPRLRLRLVVHWIEQLNSQWVNAYASASALQVVLARVRYILMLPRAIRIWAMFVAYSILLAAIFFGQRISHQAQSSSSEPSVDHGVLGVSAGEL